MTEVTGSDEPQSKKKKLDYSDDYKKLSSLLVGCQYVSFQPQATGISFQSKSEKMKETTERVTGPAQTSASAVPTEFPDQPVTLPDLPGKPLGHIKRKESKSIIKLNQIFLILIQFEKCK